jgi:hypothetical protein
MPAMMVAYYKVPVLVLEWGWSDGGYGAIPLGVDAAVLADLGHVIEPRVVKRADLSTFEEAAHWHHEREEEAHARAEEARSRVQLASRTVARLRRYALLNGCDW